MDEITYIKKFANNIFLPKKKSTSNDKPVLAFVQIHHQKLVFEYALNPTLFKAFHETYSNSDFIIFHTTISKLHKTIENFSNHRGGTF